MTDALIIREKLVEAVKKWDASRKSAAGEMEDCFDLENKKMANFFDGITVGLTEAANDIEDIIKVIS